MNNLYTTAKQPETLAQAILARPVECPSWCTATEHPLEVWDVIDDCHYKHDGIYPVTEDLQVTIHDIQPLTTDAAGGTVIEIMQRTIKPRSDVWRWEQAVPDLEPDEAEQLGRLLIWAAEQARGQAAVTDNHSR